MMSVGLCAWDLVNAAERLRDRWAESSDEVRNADLWQPLHAASDRLREALQAEEDAETMLAVFLAWRHGGTALAAAPDGEIMAAGKLASELLDNLSTEVKRRTVEQLTRE